VLPERIGGAGVVSGIDAGLARAAAEQTLRRHC